MAPDGSERRRAARRAPNAEEPLARVRLRTGRDLTVVNISASGALVEGLTRLLPNTRTDLHITTRHGRVLVRTRVVRARVWELERDKVSYRTALTFDTAVDTEAASALTEHQVPNAGAPGKAQGLDPSEVSSHQFRDERESNGPALSEPPLRQGRHGGESNGYVLPAEIPGNFTAPGNRYPNLNTDDRA